jgi:predicted phosphohydrolase
MRIVAISDTHGKHRDVGVPPGDVLIHSGDLMSSGWRTWEISDFNKWLGDQPHKHKIFIAGNHDWLFQKKPMEAQSLITNAIYLEDTGVILDGVSFYGSPVQPEFCGWAFNVRRGAAIKKYWDQIPNNVQVLITHGPPYGYGDQTRRGDDHLGCEDLFDAVKRVKPAVHIFGHIHGGYGAHEGIEHFEYEPLVGGPPPADEIISVPQIVIPNRRTTRFLNASIMNEAYKITNAPIVYDLEV